MSLIPGLPSTPVVASAGRIRAARAIAMAADLLQIAVFPAFSEGALSPANDVLDVVVAAALSALLGWHWVFLPSLLSELIPMWDLVPTWTAAVWYVTSGTAPGGGAPTARVEPPPPPPALPR
jgi:hypothetical protein